MSDAGRYVVRDGWPILIVAEDSILDVDATGVASVVERGGGGSLANVLRRLVRSPASPNRRNTQEFLRRLRERSSRPRILIAGGGTIGRGMEPLYHDADLDVVSFDIYGSPYVQFVADAHRIPLETGAVDGVVIQAVLEHVLEPPRVVAEIHRVLRPDGLVYAETPFLQHVHEGAYDFTRFTESGHRYLFRHFGCLRSGALSGAGTSLQWSIDHFVRGIFRSRRAGRASRVAFFWLPRMDAIIPAPHNVDAANGVYFLGERRERAIEPREMVTAYRGAQPSGR